MPRPLKYVRIAETSEGPRRVAKGGREIHGLHYHRTTPKGKPERGYFYRRVDGNVERLGSDLAVALRKLEGESPVPFFPYEADSGTGSVYDRALATSPPVDAPPPCQERLSDCVEFWREWKAEQGRRSGYIDETVKYFNEFVKLAGNKPVNQLSKVDFVAFERYLNRNAQKYSGNDWYHRRIKSLRAVLNHAYRKTDFPLPVAWTKWFDDVEKLTVTPVNSIKRAIPPELLRSLLRVCEHDAALDVDKMPKATQSDRAKRQRAIKRKRAGVQWQAILTLSINAGLGNQDVCDIEWSQVKLTGKLPHIDFPRTKADWRTGTPVDRLTPLLPATIQALKAWRAYEKPNGLIFRNSRRNKFRYDHVSAGFARFVKRCDYDDGHAYSFRNVRKSPGSAARDAGLPDWQVQAVLGHVADTVAARHYIEDPKPAHLREIAQAIWRTYFA